MFAEYILAAM